MHWIATFMAWAATIPEQPVGGATLATAEAVERIALPRTGAPVALDLAPLDRTLSLKTGQDTARVAAKVGGHLGTICPTMVTKADRIELSCSERRIDATLTTERGTTYLNIYLLRGLPWREGPDGPPHIHYEPSHTGLGAACPGTTPAGKGECAFHARNWMVAASHFREAMETAERSAAAVRLGDLSLIALDPATAIGWYQRTGLSGPFARMASARLCELDVTCYRNRPTLDPHVSDLPGPLRNDLLLRRARVEAYLGHFDKALEVLLEGFTKYADKSLCQGGGERLCRRLVLGSLRNTSPREAELAMEVYLELPDRETGFLYVEMVEAAAEAAARAGAPVFGGKLLSSVAPHLSPSALDDHLLRAAELFLQGRDAARARVILDFIQSRDSRAPTDPRWQAVRRSLLKDFTDEDAPGSSGASALAKAVKAASEDLAAAAAALKSSHALLEEHGMVDAVPAPKPVPGPVATEAR